MRTLEELLRFYFITDDGKAGISVVEQVDTALSAGATVIQYRSKQFSLRLYEEVCIVRKACRDHRVPFIVNDNILLAKAVDADGVHVGQEDDPPGLARRILGPKALVGLSVSSVEELRNSSLDGCDYIGCGPVFATDTKADAKPESGLGALGAVVKESILPVVAIGGITAANAGRCFEQGAMGVAVISAITRVRNPGAAARELARACSPQTV